MYVLHKKALVIKTNKPPRGTRNTKDTAQNTERLSQYKNTHSNNTLHFSS